MKDSYTKKRFNVDRHIMSCECGDAEHALIFEYDNEDIKDYVNITKVYEPFKIISVYMTYSDGWGFFNRLKLAIKYLFKKKSIWISNDVIFTESNIEQLQEWISDVKKYPLQIKQEIIDKVTKEENKETYHCVMCDSENLITFYDFERVETNLENFRYICLNCRTEFEKVGVIIKNSKELQELKLPGE